ncbi:MAG: hypothetical protein C0404_05155 [Verrucomicrobia bacterium]|nr:hypothetical protein [Verrucomicrobiota bacterium]
MQKRHKDVFSVLSYKLPAAFPVSASLRMEMPEAGRYLPVPHLHNVLEIGYCHEGRGTFSIADKLLPFSAGDVVVINQHEPHYAANSPGVHGVWSWMFFDVPKLLGPYGLPSEMLETGRFCGSAFNNVFPPARHPAMSSQALMIIDELDGKRPGYETAVRGLILALVTGLHRMEPIERTQVAAAGGREIIERLAPALNMIRRGYAGNLSASGLAAACAMSETYLRRMFRKALGRSPRAYLMEFRLAMASQELSERKLTVEAIAAKHGFPTLSCFVRAFTKHKGLPPRRWAKQAFGR